jgi:hypothetical protein
MSSIRDELDMPVAKGWRPKPGDALVGKVLRVETAQSDYGEPYPLVTILTDEGQYIAVHAFHSVLKNEFAKTKPARGDEIGLRYIGKVAGGNDRSYESYRVVVHKPGGAEPTELPASEWDALAKQADLELEGAELEDEAF